ncbi:unnamed protein product [Colias eurytheme]|nr:unnamed protein product [Colias eurytheme]
MWDEPMPSTQRDGHGTARVSSASHVFHMTRGGRAEAARRSGLDRRDGRRTATGAVERRCASQPRAPSERDAHTAPRRASPTILALEPSNLIFICLAHTTALGVYDH